MSNNTTAHLLGCLGINAPVDANGREIFEGSKLSWDFHDPHYYGRVKPWMRLAAFVVCKHESGTGLCAKGIEKELYLHDFRFQYCEVVD